MPYISNKQAAEVADGIIDSLKSKSTQDSLLSAGLAGGVAKMNGQSGGKAAVISLVVGGLTKLVSAGIRTLLKK